MAILKRRQKRLKKSSMAYTIRKFNGLQNNVKIATCQKCARKVTLQELINYFWSNEDSLVINQGFSGDFGSADLFSLAGDGSR